MTKKQFLEGATNNDLNHRIGLWGALILTEGKVVEFGSGFGSTPFLRKYCEDEGREFESYDSNKAWAEKTGATLVSDWEALNITADVLFLDHAPGERRKFDLMKYKDIAKVIVIHDTEPKGAGDYRVRELFPMFKYKQEIKSIDHEKTQAGCWATILSNHIDLSILIGEGNETFKIE
jgi:hypothetical protein